MSEEHPDNQELPATQRMSKEEAQAVIHLWALRREEREGMTARPSVQDVAEGLDVSVEEVGQLLAHVRTQRTQKAAALAQEQTRLAEERRLLAEEQEKLAQQEGKLTYVHAQRARIYKARSDVRQRRAKRLKPPPSHRPYAAELLVTLVAWLMTFGGLYCLMARS